MDKSRPLDSKLLFVGGCGRSGTTLLKTVLGNHSQISFPPETFYFVSIKKRLKASDSRVKIAAYVASRWWIKEMGVTADALVERSFGYPEYSMAQSIFLALMECQVEHQLYNYVGEKSPKNVLVASDLLNGFRQSKFIHIVRDPRSVLASYKNVDVGTNEATVVVKEWNSAVQSHMDLRSSDRYLVVKYEDLVENTEIVLERLMTFLDLEMESNMKVIENRKDKGYHDKQVHHANTLRPIFTDSVNTWSKSLSSFEVSVIEKHCAVGMDAFEYEPVFGGENYSKLGYSVSRIKEYFHKNIGRRLRQFLKRF